jgi:4'-phosphopantetheinyl transferase
VSAVGGEGTTARRETWLPPPPDVRVCVDEVHVWRAPLDCDASALEVFHATLDDDERARALRFRFDRDRAWFVAARGILRDILSRYLRHPASLIQFTYNEYGKPELVGDAGSLRFNVSHSGGAALYAFARGREVGVDVELLRDDFASVEVAGRFFSAAEIRTLSLQQPHLLTRSFFNCWTRKEAYIKALGEGLSHPLDCFAVSLAPGEPARLISTDRDPSEAADWSIIDLQPFEGYAAALAVKGSSPRLRCWDWR